MSLTPEQLYGTWKLVSWKREIVGTGERFDSYGKSPTGFLCYTREGRMSAIIVSDQRSRPADLAKLSEAEKAKLYDTSMAYGGTFRIEGDRVKHTVDISWNQFLTGTTQERMVKIDGNRMTLSTDPMVSPVDGVAVTAVLTWEKLPQVG